MGRRKFGYPEPTAEVAALIQKFKLKHSDMAKLYRVFKEVDVDKSGEIDADEFAGLFGVKRDMYLEGLFDLVLGLVNDDADYKVGEADGLQQIVGTLE